jgi:hypothetical protein
MNGDEVPVPERPSRRWPHWLLQLACLAFGVWAFYVAVRAGTSAHGVRWRTYHGGIELPGLGTIALSAGLAVWKRQRGDKSKFGWWILGIAAALGILAIWFLSLTQPYVQVSGGY